MSSLLRWLNVSSEGNIRHRLRARLNEVTCLVSRCWHEDSPERYWCLPFDLVICGYFAGDERNVYVVEW